MAQRWNTNSRLVTRPLLDRGVNITANKHVVKIKLGWENEWSPEAIECGEEGLHVHGRIATEGCKTSKQLREVQVPWT
jgi:hypothetical protein